MQDGNTQIITNYQKQIKFNIIQLQFQKNSIFALEIYEVH